MTATLVNHGMEIYLAAIAAGCGVLVAVGVGKLIGRWKSNRTPEYDPDDDDWASGEDAYREHTWPY